MLLCRCYCVNFMLKESTINWFSSSIIVSYFDLGEDDIILMLSPDTVTPCGGKRYNRKWLNILTWGQSLNSCWETYSRSTILSSRPLFIGLNPSLTGWSLPVSKWLIFNLILLPEMNSNFKTLNWFFSSSSLSKHQSYSKSPGKSLMCPDQWRADWHRWDFLNKADFFCDNKRNIYFIKDC